MSYTVRCDSPRKIAETYDTKRDALMRAVEIAEDSPTAIVTVEGGGFSCTMALSIPGLVAA